MWRRGAGRDAGGAALHVVCLLRRTLTTRAACVCRKGAVRSSNSQRVASDAGEVFSWDAVIVMLIEKSEYLPGYEISHSNLSI